MKITIEQLKTMLPTIKDEGNWFKLINDYYEEYEINTPARIAGFMAQAGHESTDFRFLEENLNYSWQRLRVVFPRYFKTDSIARQFHRKPEAIANQVYDDANRISKLGNTQAGDGWRFRGRGIFQLTGRDNYTAFANSIGITPEAAAIYLQTPRGAIHSAVWFWSSRNLNRYADRQDIVGMSKAVNGGSNGLKDRVKRFNRNLAALKSQDAYTDAPRALQAGSRGDDVKAVQRKLGFTGRTADGIFGPITGRAVSSWQRRHNLIATGKLTPTQVQMILA